MLLVGHLWSPAGWLRRRAWGLGRGSERSLKRASNRAHVAAPATATPRNDKEALPAPGAADLAAAAALPPRGLGRRWWQLRPAAGPPAPAEAAPFAAVTPAALEHLDGRWRRRLRLGPTLRREQGECGKGGLAGLRAGCWRGKRVPPAACCGRCRAGSGGHRLPRRLPARLFGERRRRGVRA